MNPKNPRKRGLASAALLLLACLPFLCSCAARTEPVETPRAESIPPLVRTPPYPRVPVPEWPRSCVFKNVEKIVAVGDLHGAYEEFLAILSETELINRNLHWTGGRTHLVQLGDVMDRGPDARGILDLIRRLQREAADAGGAVHMLLGNHEELNIIGYSFDIEGYVTPEQFRAFLPDWFLKPKDAVFRAQAATYEEYNRLWEEEMNGNREARDQYTRTFNQNYGRWLSQLPAVLVINDIVFVHGGLSEALSVLPCETINTNIAREFDRYLRWGDRNWAWIYQPSESSPLWNRDLATKSEDIIREEVDRILANLKARAIVVGHSPTPNLDMNPRFGRFGEKVWDIDTGIWMKEGGLRSALVIKNGTFRMITAGSGERR